MERKVLVLDIDGTLINSKKEITPATYEYIEKIQEMGHIVVLASGRPYKGMGFYIEALNLKKYGGYVLSFNGAKVVDCKTGETILKDNIDRKFLPVIVDYAIENNIGMVTYTDQEVISATPIDEHMLYEARLNKMAIKKVDDFIKFVDFDVPKCLLTADPKISEKHEKNLYEILNKDLNVFRSEPYFIEITTKTVDKAKSLEGLLEKIGISVENTIACGDGFNDLTMIKFAGVGVAMENAQEIVKDAADFITTSNDMDGVVLAIKKFIL